MVFGDPNDAAMRQGAIEAQKQSEAIRNAPRDASKIIEQISPTPVNITVKQEKPTVIRQTTIKRVKPRTRVRRSYLQRVGLGVGTSKTQRARREGTLKTLTALGVTGGTAGAKRYANRGRPRGSYKYGVPIQDYKKAVSRRNALLQAYQSQQERALVAKGYTPEQINQLRFEQDLEKGGLAAGAALSASALVGNKMLNDNNVQQSIPQSPQTQISPVTTNQGESFEEFVQKNTISPNTQRMLERIKRVQNKALVDDARQQRIQKERRMVWEATSLLNARNLFKGKPGEMESWLDRPETNSLNAPNLFKIDRIKNPSILDTGGRPSVLDTSANINPRTGKSNTLNFFGDSNILQHDQDMQNKFRLNFWSN